MNKKDKLYFSKQDGFEFANSINTWKDIMRFENVDSLELIRARAVHGVDFFFCKEYNEVGETKTSCGKQCPDYKPRNKKNGICSQYGYCYVPDESEKIILKL